MNRVPDTSGASPFLIEKYQSKYQNCVPAIQVALVAIMVTGITLALLSHFDYLHPTFVYVGAATSVASLIVIGILGGCQKNNLEASIKDVRSFADLKVLLDTAEISTPSCDCAHFWGTDDSLKVTSKSLHGQLSSSELHDKIEKMMKFPQFPFDEKEQEAAQQIAASLDAKYKTVDLNQCGFIPNVSKYIK